MAAERQPLARPRCQADLDLFLVITRPGHYGNAPYHVVDRGIPHFDRRVALVRETVALRTGNRLNAVEDRDVAPRPLEFRRILQLCPHRRKERDAADDMLRNWDESGTPGHDARTESPGYMELVAVAVHHVSNLRPIERRPIRPTRNAMGSIVLPDFSPNKDRACPWRNDRHVAWGYVVVRASEQDRALEPFGNLCVAEGAVQPSAHSGNQRAQLVVAIAWAVPQRERDGLRYDTFHNVVKEAGASQVVILVIALVERIRIARQARLTVESGDATVATDLESRDRLRSSPVALEGIGVVGPRGQSHRPAGETRPLVQSHAADIILRRGVLA
mmetsp:Transcript_1661/g.4925  ORF Transcript_1661/g.4925 Transcript_1661/m.4925 type:complete len:331 (-) Transcript_1661:328-1320(-)